MKRGEQILLPARAGFIWTTLLAAFCIELLPLGVQGWWPDILMMTLVFWAIHQPQHIGIGIAFSLGLLADVQAASLLGQHALAYAVLIFAVQSVRNKLSWYRSGVPQALFLFQFFVLAQVVLFVIGYLSSRMLPPIDVLLAPLLQTALWPVLRLFLLMPQRRAPEQDDHRPL